MEHSMDGMDHMPMGNTDMSMGGTTEMPMPMEMKMKHMMWMWFHTAINDTVLFSNWHVTTVGGMIIACLIFFFGAIGIEFLKWGRWRIEMAHFQNAAAQGLITYYKKLLSPNNFLQTGLFFVQVVLSYLLMLVFMTFSIWLGLAVTVGTAVGYFLFGNRTFNLPANLKAPPHSSNDAQNDCC
uniref:Copper transport protein n=1 Tax=Rhabditophanes sp. KR3021 TaxID=114890 RepID=A0AC35TGU6_9BILA